MLSGVETPLPHHVAIAGLGQIGGSLFLRLAAAGAPVTGYDADPVIRDAARGEVAAPAAVADDLAVAVASADLVVIAVPLPAFGAVLGDLAATPYRGLVTDVTSVKEPVRRLVAARHPAARWVGGHPMAGRETSGFRTADPKLVDGSAWVLTLDEGTRLDDWLTTAGWIVRLGARVVPATSVDHDSAVARISQAPHIVAAALTTCAAAGPAGSLALALAAGSFRDGTRVAASRPALTAAMCGGNARALAAELDALSDRIAEARGLLDGPDPVAGLESWLGPAHAVRSSWPLSAGEPTTLHADVAGLLALGRSGGWVTAVATDRQTVTAVRPAR